jgi:predicted dehydrogenase
MTKKLKVGIGGYGRSGCDIHTRWLRQVQSKFTIVAVADQLPKRRREARSEWGCEVYDDYSKLLKNTEMDLFINALPSALHGKGTVAACRAGNHVVCEKPVGRTVKEFDAMAAATCSTPAPIPWTTPSCSSATSSPRSPVK